LTLVKTLLQCARAGRRVRAGHVKHQAVGKYSGGLAEAQLAFAQAGAVDLQRRESPVAECEGVGKEAEVFLEETVLRLQMLRG
jgi:hypothetical protein